MNKDTSKCVTRLVYANDLIVGQKALGARVVARLAAARLLVDVSAHLIVCVALRERERAAVEGNAHNQLVGGAAVVHPQLHSVVLQTHCRLEIQMHYRRK